MPRPDAPCEPELPGPGQPGYLLSDRLAGLPADLPNRRTSHSLVDPLDQAIAVCGGPSPRVMD
jgi:hypothetical protein